MVALNQSKSYGTIYGENHGARYHQRGLYFDGDGELIPDHPLYGPEEKKRVASLLAKEAAAPKKKEATPEEDYAEDDEEFFSDAGDDEEDEEDESPPPRKPVAKPKPGKPPAPPPPQTVEKQIGPGVDLKLWALGKKSYHFLAVRSEIQRKYNFMAMNKISALNFLVDEGVIKEKDLPKEK